MKRPELIFGSAVLLTLLGVAIFAPWLAPFDPNFQALEHRLEGPSWKHPCGLDELGRDILSRLLYGTRISALVGLCVVGLAGLLGLFLGAAAGYSGGWVDGGLMRLSDVFLAFPGILLAIALMAVLGPALSNVILALVVVGWVGYARLVRGQVLQLREMEFVAAARVEGASSLRILRLHILPCVLPVLTVQASLGLAGAILSEAGLSFLGLGVQPPTPSWGAMINAGRSHLLDAPHLALFPGLAILITVLGLNFLGDALVDLLDPYRHRRESA